MAAPRDNRWRTGIAVSGAVAMITLMVSSAISVVMVVATAAETGGETAGTVSRQGTRLGEAAAPVSSATPGTLQAPVAPVSPSPSSSPPEKSHPRPTWTGKPGGEIYYGTFSKDECVKRGEEGLAARTWSAYSCKQLPKRDGGPKPGELIEDLEVVTESATGDHRLWVVDWLCKIRIEDNCG
jgi:hypothetical protein